MIAPQSPGKHQQKLSLKKYTLNPSLREFLPKNEYELTIKMYFFFTKHGNQKFIS